MIIKKSQAPAERAERESFGVTETLRLSDAGGLSQYGAYVQALHPGARSSNNHRHENEDEFLYVLAGEVPVTEGYLIVGPRVNQDVCHYADTGRTLHTDGSAWRLREADGQLFKSGAF